MGLPKSWASQFQETKEKIDWPITPEMTGKVTHFMNKWFALDYTYNTGLKFPCLCKQVPGSQITSHPTHVPWNVLQREKDGHEQETWPKTPSLS